MFNVLITTIKTYNAPAIHTVIAQFDTPNEALRAINAVNQQKLADDNQVTGVKQTALALF